MSHSMHATNRWRQAVTERRDDGDEGLPEDRLKAP